MSGIEVASLLWSLPGLVIPITMAVFTCIGDESQHSWSDDEDATMNIRPRQGTPPRRRSSPVSRYTQDHGQALELGVLSLDRVGGFDEEDEDDFQERRQGTANDDHMLLLQSVARRRNIVPSQPTTSSMLDHLPTRSVQ